MTDNVNQPGHFYDSAILKLDLKIQGQGHDQGQTWWLYLRPCVQLTCSFFVSWQLNNFWLIYSKIHIWPGNFEVKVIAKVKLDGHIWCLNFNRYFSFVTGQSDHFVLRCITKSIFENSRSKSLLRSNPMVIFQSICFLFVSWQSDHFGTRAVNHTKNNNKITEKLFWSYREQNCAAGGGGSGGSIRTDTKHKVTPGIPVSLNYHDHYVTRKY